MLCEENAVVHLPDNPKGSIADGPVRLYIQLLLQVVGVLLLIVVVVVSFDSRGGLNLCGSHSCRRPGGLSGSWRGKVGLLLAWVEHDCCSGSRGGVLLNRVHGGGRARVL